MRMPAYPSVRNDATMTAPNASQSLRVVIDENLSGEQKRDPRGNRHAGEERQESAGLQGRSAESAGNISRPPKYPTAGGRDVIPLSSGEDPSSPSADTSRIPPRSQDDACPFERRPRQFPAGARQPRRSAGTRAGSTGNHTPFAAWRRRCSSSTYSRHSRL